MRIALVSLLLLSIVQVVHLVELRTYVERLGAAPSEPTVQIPATFPPDLVDDTILRLPPWTDGRPGVR